MFDVSSPLALFDDNLSSKGDLLLDELDQTITCSRLGDIEATFAQIEAARKRGCWVALAARYELGYLLEPRLREHYDEDGAPLLTAWVFGRAQRLDHVETQALIDASLAAMDEHQRLAGVAALRRVAEETTYSAAVERIRALIDAGDCYQVNFTFPLSGELFGQPLALYDALRRSQPVSFGAFVRHPAGNILSRSPELFVERNGDRLTCRPMKGTAARDTDPAELLASEKNRAENVMIVDLIRNDLGRLASPGGVKVESLFDIEAYRSLWQMTSTISAQPIDADLYGVFRALFPCGSITGAPKIRAMEIIRELETAPRGLYCGALGWISPDGDFRFSVPIRTLEADLAGHFRCGLGSGIVADSDAADEWRECLLKGRFLTGLQPSFGLIETLRCEPHTITPYPLLERHLKRLTASAAHFGFDFDRERATAQLMDVAAMLDTTSRVRLELRPDASMSITHGPLLALNPKVVTVCLAQERVHSDDPLLRHKTTARELYDQGLQRAVTAGHFDALFFNERDELAEGARSNILIDNGDDTLLTPPLECGVLDGVMRRKLLDEGRAREGVISRAMLLGSRKLYVANALRGLIEVELRDA